MRLRVARAVVDEGLARSAVARACGVSANTAQVWIRRYRRGGVDALMPARAPLGVPPREADARREAVVALRRAHPEIGARRIRDLQRFHALGVAERTVRRVLREEGLLTPPAPAAKRPPRVRHFERAEPNQLWQSDLFTFLLRRHERVYVAAFLDDCSRFVVALVLAHHQRASLVLEALGRGIAEYGAPREVLTDQGRQYTAWRGETSFEEELRRHGIRHLKSRAHHPQTLGKIERFWKTLWEELLARTVFADFADCERRVGLYMQHYNFQRPHQALGGLVPADRFFRAAPHVRAAIEAQVAANALRLAQQQPTQPPFYLVGQLGDRPVSIAASRQALDVKVGDSVQRIPLPQEEDDEYPQRPRGRRDRDAPAGPTASGPADQVAGPSDGGGPGGEGALSAGLGCAVGAGAGQRGNSGRSAGPAHLLSARDAGAPGDAHGADPGGGDGGAGRSAGESSADCGAGSPGEGPGPGQAAGGAAAGPHAQGDRAEGRPARVRPATPDDVDPGERDDADAPDAEPFDIDAGWRGRVLSWATKLAGAVAPSRAAREEGRHAAEAELQQPAGGAGGGAAALPNHAGGDRGQRDGERGGAAAGAVAAALSQSAASGPDGVRDGDRAAAARAPEPGGDGEDAGAEQCAAAAGECPAGGAGAADPAAPGAGGRQSASASSPGIPLGRADADEAAAGPPSER
jgi:transposase InsO family protein